MSTITKEWLQQKIADMEAARDEIPFGLDEDDSNTLAGLRIALASLEAEAVGTFRKGPCGYSPSFHEDAVPLYTATPARVSVPDEIESTSGSDFDDYYCDGWNACRAAMLQGAEQPQSAQQNIPENIPVTQFKPVADLYGLTSPTGGETSFTFDAVEARDFIDGGWSCQEYVELERFQEAVRGNSPVIPDGWALVPIEPTAEMISSGIAAHYERSQIQIHDRPAPGPMECVYVAMLAAAPQQEVKP